MRHQAQERIPSATAAYLEAYSALEASAGKAQALVDRLLTIALALTDTGSLVGLSDAWKAVRIDELPTLKKMAGELGKPMRLTGMPKAEQLLEAIASWRKKRNYLQQLWDGLPAEVQAVLKFPQTLD